jgi:predicted anti-sigma-YlaC factor YlaD
MHLSLDESMAYLGQLASPSVRATLERHLLNCPQCRACVVATARALGGADSPPDADRGVTPPTGWH